jgi:hypothetical protein
VAAGTVKTPPISSVEIKLAMSLSPFVPPGTDGAFLFLDGTLNI